MDKRLRHAKTALAALTPPRGRGRRQITDEATLVEAIDLVLKAHRVEGLRGVDWEKQVKQHTQYLGRGRGSAGRQQRVIEQTRSHITRIARPEDKIAGLRQRCGWKAFVPNARPLRLSFEDPERKSSGGLRPCQGCRKQFCNGWGWVLIDIIVNKKRHGHWRTDECQRLPPAGEVGRGAQGGQGPPVSSPASASPLLPPPAGGRSQAGTTCLEKLLRMPVSYSR